MLNHTELLTKPATAQERMAIALVCVSSLVLHHPPTASKHTSRTSGPKRSMHPVGKQFVMTDAVSPDLPSTKTVPESDTILSVERGGTEMPTRKFAQADSIGANDQVDAGRTCIEVAQRL